MDILQDISSSRHHLFSLFIDHYLYQSLPRMGTLGADTIRSIFDDCIFIDMHIPLSNNHYNHKSPSDSTTYTHLFDGDTDKNSYSTHYFDNTSYLDNSYSTHYSDNISYSNGGQTYLIRHYDKYNLQPSH